MDLKSIVIILLLPIFCSISTPVFSCAVPALQTNNNNNGESVIPCSDGVDLVGVAGMLDLIREGEELLQKEGKTEGNVGDLILVIGNTGVGRTSLTKLLTGQLSSLSSYWAGDGFLIQDSTNRDEISDGNSTLVTKSTFPLFATKEGDGHVEFCDLPGFQNTLGPTYEIPLAVLSHTLAGRARRVKIVFVVNYSSLQTGESRMDFINFLENAGQFLSHPAQLSEALSLVATKVSRGSKNSTMDDQAVIQGIVRFIENVKGHLGKVVRDPKLRSRVSEILEALLHKEVDGSYGRIGVFPEPSKAESTLAPEFQQVKEKLTRQIIDRSHYVNSSIADFGIALSPAAKVFSHQTKRILEGQILDLVQQVGDQLRSKYRSSASSQSQDVLPKLYRDLKTLRAMTFALDEVKSMDPRRNPLSFLRSEFVQILNESLGSSSSSSSINIPNVDQLVLKMVKIGQYLEFLEDAVQEKKSSIVSGRRSLEEWSDSISEAVDAVSNEVYRVAEDFNLQLEATASTVFQRLTTLYQTKVNETEDEDKDELVGELSVDIHTLTELIGNGYGQTTVNSFINGTIASLDELSIKLPSSDSQNQNQNYRPLAEDLDLTDEVGEEWGSSPLKSHTWLRPVEQFVRLLRQLKAQVQTEVQEIKYRKIIDATTPAPAE